MKKRQWADKYGAQWYLHYDGKPPHDDDDDYRWDGFQWIKKDCTIVSLRDINEKFDAACRQEESQ